MDAFDPPVERKASHCLKREVRQPNFLAERDPESKVALLKGAFRQ